MGNCITRLKWSSRYPDITSEVIENLQLTPLNKVLLTQRYVRIMKKMDTNTYNTTFIYNILSLFITVGSIAVPALLSIKDTTFFTSDDTNGENRGNSVNSTIIETTQTTLNNNGNNTNYSTEQTIYLFWVTFSISLLVTISNGIIKLFSIDQTYIIRHLRYNDLRRQGWLFFSLAGPYIKYKSHNQAIKSFMYNIEKIKTNQLIEEFTPETTASKEQMTYDAIELDKIDKGVNTSRLLETNLYKHDLYDLYDGYNVSDILSDGSSPITRNNSSSTDNIVLDEVISTML